MNKILLSIESIFEYGIISTIAIIITKIYIQLFDVLITCFLISNDTTRSAISNKAITPANTLFVPKAIKQNNETICNKTWTN